MVKILYPCALVLALLGCGPSNEPAQMSFAQGTSDALAKPLFRAQTTPAPGPAQVFGRVAGGCIQGAVEIPETGPTWQAMRLSRDKNWGHPVALDFIRDHSAKVSRLPGWEGLYVGDLGLPRGGPNNGHASHQAGLDIDFWMLPPTRLNLTPSERENISSITMQRTSGAFVNNSWTEQHREMLKLAASDPRVDRIFIFAGAKVDLCRWADATGGNRDWLRKVRPWWGHHFHYHVRLKCPADSPFCRDSGPLPAGDGCAWADEWVDTRILNPPPPDPNAPPRPPRKPPTLANLPAQCSALVGR